MKKALLFISIVVLLSGGLPATTPSIEVTKPDAPNTSWEIGSMQNIEWTTNGLPASARLRISLVKGNTNLGVIADDVAKNASPFSWKVGDYQGGSATIGTDYYIKIKQIGAAVTDRSDNPFRIRLKYLQIKPLAQIRPIPKRMVLTFLPDLTGKVTYELAPHHPEGYNVSHFHFTVTNTGLGPTKNSTNVGAKLINYGPDGTTRLSGHDAWWPATVPILAPGESFTYHGTFNFRAPNYYAVEAWVDSEGKVEETGTGETNNRFDTAKFKVP